MALLFCERRDDGVVYIRGGVDWRQSAGADKDGLLGFRDMVSSMGAVNLFAIQGDDFHEGAESEFLFQQKEGSLEHGEG